VRVARVQSFVTVANVRGRPVKIEQVAILKPNTMSHPRGWEFGQDLAEGQRATFTFDRDEYPNAVPVAMDTVGRVWPRRREFRERPAICTWRSPMPSRSRGSAEP